MTPKAKKQKFGKQEQGAFLSFLLCAALHSLTFCIAFDPCSTIGHSTPISAIAARRQQLIHTVNIDSTPEVEHEQGDDQDEKESLDSSESSDSDTTDSSDQDEKNRDAEFPSTAESGSTIHRQIRRDRR